MKRRSFFAGLAAGLASLFAPTLRKPQAPKGFVVYAGSEPELVGILPQGFELTMILPADSFRPITFRSWENVPVGVPDDFDWRCWDEDDDEIEGYPCRS